MELAKYDLVFLQHNGKFTLRIKKNCPFYFFSCKKKLNAIKCAVVKKIIRNFPVYYVKETSTFGVR